MPKVKKNQTLHIKNMRFYYNYFYFKSPVWMQNIFISVFGIKLFVERYSGVYRATFRDLKKLDYSNKEDQKSIQNKRFVELITYANSKSPFYKTFYKGIEIDKIKTIKDISKLPVLEKEILRANIGDFYSIKPMDGIKSFTGGTTGKSLEVVFTKQDFQIRQAHLHYFENLHGIKPGMKRATFNGREIISSGDKSKIFWRNNYIRHQRLYSTFHLTNSNLPYYIEDLNFFKPKVINGFVSAINELASFIDRNNLILKFQPIVIFTTSETLMPHHRILIEKVFRCPVRNQYASAEGAPFITECPQGKLHYNIDTGIIETLETVQGKEMLVTSFTTHGTPLIRYRIGDLWEPSKGKCVCGSSHPLVKSIDGRQVEYLSSKSKGRVSLSHLADVIKGLPSSIVNVQFIQNSLDRIDVLIVLDDSIFNNAHQKKIMDQLHYRFGTDMEFNIIQVDKIDREKSGKMKLIQNNLVH
jgi:phenylacetate-CoA ligase